ncbi:hypothetical protein [Micromonospora sp. NPDC003241]
MSAYPEDAVTVGAQPAHGVGDAGSRDRHLHHDGGLRTGPRPSVTV